MRNILDIKKTTFLTKHTKRPPTNDRTCMGWHTRHASTLSGLEGHLRPETLNLTAWNHALGLQQPKKKKKKIFI